MQEASKYILLLFCLLTQNLRDKLLFTLLEHLREHTTNLNSNDFSVDKKNQLVVTFCFLYFSSNSCSTCFGQPCAHHQELTA